MSRKWSEDNMMAFVRLYKGEPVLWDPSDCNYRMKEARNEALVRIVQGSGVEGFTVKECKVKIKNLRSHYWQEVAKVQRFQTEGGAQYRPTVVWFKTVDSFLKRFVHQNCHSISGKTYSKYSKYANYYAVSDDSLEKDELKLVRAEEGTRDLPSVSDMVRTPSAVSKTSRGSTPTRQLADRKRTRQQSPSCSSEEDDHESKVCRRAEETEFDLWAKSVARQLNDMEPRRALDLQLRIQTLICEERIGFYNEGGG